MNKGDQIISLSFRPKSNITLGVKSRVLCGQRTFDLKPISKFVIIMNEGIVFAWAKMSFKDFALKTESHLEL